MVYNTHPQQATGGKNNGRMPSQRRRKDPIPNLNVMLVGQAGGGKTSFLRTICEDLRTTMVQGTLKESKPMVLDGALQPTEEFYSVSMHLVDIENDEKTALTLIDTPGISHMVSIETLLQHICKYIDHQFERTFIEQTKVKRDPKTVDTHIHACIYFVDTIEWTDGLTDVDRYMLRMLSSRVNVIPVLGKADTLTITQRDLIKRTCRADLFDTYQIPVYGNIGLQDDNDEEQEENGKDPASIGTSIIQPSVPAAYISTTPWGSILGMLHECIAEEPDNEDARAMIDYLRHMPLCLIGYEEDPETGRPIVIEPTAEKMSSHSRALGRRYPWATVECCNPSHCDFQMFKLLFGSPHRNMLRIDTYERFYEKYRAEQLMSRQANKPSDPPGQTAK